jgi:arylsulfatase A-like enzyme
MKKKSHWKILIALCGIAGLVPGVASVHAEDRRPNIIFIMADDMGYGDAGCYGQKLIKTPFIDQLAKEGMRFTQCYAGSTVCAPSRSVLMTGKHTGHTRVRGNTGQGGFVGLGGAKGRIPLAKEDITVAAVLKMLGYSTAMTGKWGLGEPDTTGEPRRQGFDQWYGFLNQKRAHNHYPEYIWLNETELVLPANADGKKKAYAHDLFTLFALNFIRSRGGQPFFLYLPYTVPHSTLEVPSQKPYAAQLWSEEEKNYAAMITRMDADIGKILGLLQQSKMEEDTIIFFCSDNGAANRYDGLFNSSGPLKGRKRDMTEGGLRVPMVVRWPGKIAPGVTSDVVWSFTDFMSTAAELGGGIAPRNDGISMVPILTGKADQLDDRYLYWEFFEKGFQQAARWKHWKVIRPAQDAKLELYDLHEDIGETTNVAEKHPAIVKQFEDYLKTARTESKEWPLAKAPEKK